MKADSPAIKLKSLQGKRVVLVGIGHQLRGDDAAGIELARRLRRRGKTTAIEAGSVPENYLGPIISRLPEVVLLADAALLGNPPGEWSLLTGPVIRSGTASTHDASLATFLEYLEKETGAEVFILGIRPRTREWGEKLSAEVLRTVRYLEKILFPVLPDSL